MQPGILRCAPSTLGRTAAIGAMLFLFAAPAAPQQFGVRYVVSLEDRSPPTAMVRWELAGAEEIERITLRFRSVQPTDLQSSGTLTKDGSVYVWHPAKPYAHLTYRVAVNSVRGKQERFDSYAGPRWMVSRARQLFPLVGVWYRSPDGHLAPSDHPNTRATLAFQVPRGWRCATIYPSRGENLFEIEGPRPFRTPRGWFACGRLQTEAREIASVRFEIVQTSGTETNAEEIFNFLEPTFPLLHRLLGYRGSRILIVRAPDPMWHGGISGESSFFIHAQRPLRDVDKTSPYLHELFHVLQPFKPAADADWIVEGLAEYYSLELQRRAGLLDERTFSKGLRFFERYGRWDVDLRTQKDNAATNNTAPLVLYALDQRIQRLTAGKARLDDVVRLLAKQPHRVDSNAFQRAAETVAGKPLTRFFRKYVEQGARPAMNRAGQAE
jgi:hypothetical protein